MISTDAMRAEAKIENYNSKSHHCHLGLRTRAGSTLKIKVSNSRDCSSLRPQTCTRIIVNMLDKSLKNIAINAVKLKVLSLGMQFGPSKHSAYLSMRKIVIVAVYISNKQ